MKYKILYSKAYKKAIKHFTSADLELLESVIDTLAKGEKLEAKYKDHSLKGAYKNFRECHIKPDLLLIYQKQDEILILTCVNAGSHSTLFKK